jgi:hypothetical protein
MTYPDRQPGMRTIPVLARGPCCWVREPGRRYACRRLRTSPDQGTSRDLIRIDGRDIAVWNWSGGIAIARPDGDSHSCGISFVRDSILALDYGSSNGWPGGGRNVLGITHARLGGGRNNCGITHARPGGGRNDCGIAQPRPDGWLFSYGFTYGRFSIWGFGGGIAASS